MDIGERYRNVDDLEASTEYHLKARKLSRELNYLRGLYDSSDYYSFILTQQGLYDSAIVVNKEMMELAIKHSDTYQAVAEKCYLAKSYINKGFHETALAYLMEALAYFEQGNYPTPIGYVYNQLQIVYNNMGNYESAIRYGKKALMLHSDTLSLEYGYTLLFLSISYKNLHPPQDEKALTYLQKVLHIAVLIGDAYMETQAYIYIADIYLQENRMDESESYYRKALGYFNKEDISPNNFCNINIGLAKIAMLRNDFKQAEAMAQHNLELSSRYGMRQEEKNALFFLWELSAAKHDYVGCNRWKAAADSMQNIVVNETMLHAVEELQIKYETEKKELTISALEEEKQLMSWLSMTGGSVLLLGLTALFFLWRWSFQKKRLAEQQVKQLEQEKQLIITQAVLDGEIQERTRLARDLHDGLGSILAAAKYNLIGIKNTSGREVIHAERFDKAVNLLDESMREMRRVAHHLTPDSLSNSNLKQSIADFCNSIPHVTFTYYGDETRLDSKLEVMLYRIMHELVSNALKHSGAEHILVEIVRYDDKISLTVQDDGCGFDETTVTKGMGLSNIRTRVATYNGNLLIDSKAGIGTEINVKLRITN